MGASTFLQIGKGKTLHDAFETARDQAAWEYGHAGYTGTLAEKNDYVLISAKPMTEEKARALAHQLMDKADPRIHDKWGPAGAIRIDTETWLFFGWASD